MASRFTQGTNERTLSRISKPAVDPMRGSKGMPGYIKTGQDTSSGGLTTSSGTGPKREGPIGRRGSSANIDKMDAQKARGSMDKNYRATSTGPGGTIKANTTTGKRGGSASIGSNRGEGSARGAPKGGAKMYGGTASMGSRGTGGGGHAGKMESMKGRARTSWER